MKNDKKNRLAGEALSSAIEAACDGLVFISETDSPVKPVFVSKTDAVNIEEAILILAGSPASEINTSDADAFFSRLTLDREWHGESERTMVSRFRILKELLYANLADLQQYKLGRTRITVYVAGIDASGNIAGITTEAVET